MEKKQEKKTGKARAWTFALYEDSTNIEQFLENAKEEARLGLQALAIRHDRDENPDGTKKKTHWHVIIMWDSPTTYNNALTVAKGLSGSDEGVSIVEAVRNLSGATRYLIHMDNPEKFQYDKKDVFEFGPVEFDELINSSQNDRIELKRMTAYIRDNAITHFDMFAYYCMDNDPTWHRILMERNTFYIRTLIQAQHFRLKEEKEKMLYFPKTTKTKVDPETGEIMEVKK